jgi:hypothetical protein
MPEDRPRGGVADGPAGAARSEGVLVRSDSCKGRVVAKDIVTVLAYATHSEPVVYDHLGIGAFIIGPGVDPEDEGVTSRNL